VAIQLRCLQIHGQISWPCCGKLPYSRQAGEVLACARKLTHYRHSGNWATLKNLESIVVRDPAIMSGAPTFRSTRVLVRTLFEYLEAGHSLERFLEGSAGRWPRRRSKKPKNPCSPVARCAFCWMSASTRGFATLMPEVLHALETLKPGDVLRIGIA
jgi:hypothetical protein